MKNGNINLDSLKTSLKKSGSVITRYRVFIFFLLVAAVYGFIIYRIGVLSGAEPDTTTTTQVSKRTAQPRISPDTLQKIQSLQDNSVSVQSLFDAARQNPFQE